MRVPERFGDVGDGRTADPARSPGLKTARKTQDFQNFHQFFELLDNADFLASINAANSGAASSSSVSCEIANVKAPTSARLFQLPCQRAAKPSSA